MNDVLIAFSIFAAIMVLGFVGDVISRKILIPNVIMLIILGIVCGPLLNLFPYSSLIAAVPYVAPLTIAFISFEAGMSMDIYKVLEHSRRAVSLSLIGFLLSMAAVGSLLHFALGIRWAYALLLASAWSGVNIAIVSSVLKYIKVREETHATLSMIALIDDPLVLVTTLMILRYILLGGLDLREISSTLISNVSSSVVLGAVLGVAWLNILYLFRRGEYTYTCLLYTSDAADE